MVTSVCSSILVPGVHSALISIGCSDSVKHCNLKQKQSEILILFTVTGYRKIVTCSVEGWVLRVLEMGRRAVQQT